MTDSDVSQRGHRMCTSFMEGTVDVGGAWLEVTSDVRRNHVEQFTSFIMVRYALLPSNHSQLIFAPGRVRSLPSFRCKIAPLVVHVLMLVV